MHPDSRAYRSRFIHLSTQLFSITFHNTSHTRTFGAVVAPPPVVALAGFGDYVALAPVVTVAVTYSGSEKVVV